MITSTDAKKLFDKIQHTHNKKKLLAKQDRWEFP